MRKRAYLKKCDICNCEYSSLAFNRHYKVCDGSPKEIKTEICFGDLVCIFCGRYAKNRMSFVKHEQMCSGNPNRIKHSGFCNEEDPKGNVKRGCNQYTKAKRLGLPKPVVTEETKEKIRAGNKRSNNCITFSSKACNRFVARLCKIIDSNQFSVGRIASYENTREYFLCDENGRSYAYDLCFIDLKVMIEYQGVAFHPKNEHDQNFRLIFESFKSVEDVWKKDREKERIAKKHGFDIYYVWSDNEENDTQKIVEVIKQKIGH